MAKLKPPLISNGKLTIPLYHGTSEYFLKSILEHGLGGFNIIKSLKVIQLLKELYNIADNLLTDENHWSLDKIQIEPMNYRVTINTKKK